jgi:GNAT superfamily N-acetyltransferase
MIVREVEKKDSGVLAKLMTELGYPTSTEGMGRRLAEISADPSYCALVAEKDGRVLGMVGLHVERYYEKDGSCARIISLVVGSEHRGEGVGRVLISAGEDWAREKGARDVMLTTHKRRAGAHDFYRSVGYEATGYRFYKEL